MIAGIWHGARTLRQSGRHEGHLGCTYGGSQVPPARHFVLSGAEGSHLASWWGEYSGTLGHFERVQKAEAEGWAPYDEGVSWDVSSSARSGAPTSATARHEGSGQGDLPGKRRGRAWRDSDGGHLFCGAAWHGRLGQVLQVCLALRGTSGLDRYYKFGAAGHERLGQLLQVCPCTPTSPDWHCEQAGHLLSFGWAPLFWSVESTPCVALRFGRAFFGTLEGNKKNKKTRKRGHRAHPRDTRLSTFGHRAGPSPP